jgi:hypothetical protein
MLLQSEFIQYKSEWRTSAMKQKITAKTQLLILLIFSCAEKAVITAVRIIRAAGVHMIGSCMMCAVSFFNK